jgi:hypothetical protein
VEEGRAAEGVLTGPLGPRYVFDSHYYDGTYAAATGRIRDRADELATAPFVSEFGHRMTGWGSDRGPWMTRAMYQGMDHGIRGADRWEDAAVRELTDWKDRTFR